jgi:hypothetical protein
MDALAIHPYHESSEVAPTFAHPNTTPIGIADYAKLVGLLAEAFDGTGRPGSTLPILYAEYGVETRIPSAKASEYTGTEPATIKSVPESTQASYYRQAMAMSGLGEPDQRALADAAGSADGQRGGMAGQRLQPRRDRAARCQDRTRPVPLHLSLSAPVDRGEPRVLASKPLIVR